VRPGLPAAAWIALRNAGAIGGTSPHPPPTSALCGDRTGWLRPGGGLRGAAPLLG
jgi:hypothetical protein